MEISEFESLILKEIEIVVEKILHKNPAPPISAKSRAGAEISSLLEKQFVLETKEHAYFKDSESSPDGATKNPWDARTYFSLKEHKELIWIDFKAVKVSSTDSNPDIGTPDKIIDFIIDGNFYLVYVFVYYKETDNGLEFVKNEEGKYVKTYFLKDINSTFRRNPKNQLQVNVSAKPEIRSRESFINMLLAKIKESHIRQIKISSKALKDLKNGEMKTRLIESNLSSEDKIKKI